jgi:hypothetical protein
MSAKSQKNDKPEELRETYTVMIDDQAVVVEASSNEEAVELAKEKLAAEPEQVSTENSDSGE